MHEDKTLLITGGTGSFGNAVLRKGLADNFKRIIIFSRDELKQHDMRSRLNNSRVEFMIGDVRDFDSIKRAMHGVDYVFHAAALKQVPSCEFFPMEAVKTNILGTNNVLNAAESSGVEKLVCLSTDKAAYPINAMGMSKALMEKVVQSYARSKSGGMKVAVTRYGNVIASRGSVIPIFISQLRNKQHCTVTSADMTRFMMSLDDAVELVMFAFQNTESGEVFIQKSPAATLTTLVHALAKMLDCEALMKEIGIRHGEKKYETLMTAEEAAKSVDMGHYFKIPLDVRDLNYANYFTEGSPEAARGEYNSDNTERLDSDQLATLLSGVVEVKGLI